MIGAMADDFEMTLRYQNSVASFIPTFLIRYEDLKTDPIPTVKDLFKFLLDTP